MIDPSSAITSHYMPLSTTLKHGDPHISRYEPQFFAHGIPLMPDVGQAPLHGGVPQPSQRLTQWQRIKDAPGDDFCCLAGPLASEERVPIGLALVRVVSCQ